MPKPEFRMNDECTNDECECSTQAGCGRRSRRTGSFAQKTRCVAYGFRIRLGFDSEPFEYSSFVIFLLSCCSLFAQGQPATTRAAAVATTQFTPEQQKRLDEAESLTLQVVRLFNGRKYDEAIPLAQRCVDIRREILGENHPDYAM